MKAIRLELDDDLHTRFRVLAAERGLTMSQLARALAEAFIRKPADVAPPKRGKSGKSARPI
jgi:antitoxin component of RelBE/YafQ-DinJ toxin-antitoxin module